MLLPTKEYGELCHAIRTKYANRILGEGAILYKNHYYRYTFDAEQQRIYCVDKIPIVGNERLIAGYMEVENVNKN